jgi:hypothetical protein
LFSNKKILNLTVVIANPRYELTPTFQIHARNPLFNVHPRPCLGVSLSAIYRILLKGCLVIFSGVAIHIGIRGAGEQSSGYQKTN